MDLKWLLVRRITFVALTCFLAGSALALFQSAREARRQNAELAELTARQLDLQLSRIDRSTDLPERFPDWGAIASYSLRSGQCVAFHGVEGAILRSSCAGIDAGTIGAPSWFLATYRSWINPRLAAVSPIRYRGVDHGNVVAAFDPAATAANAWSTIVPLLALSAALVSILCLVTYFVVARALLPTQEILSALNRLGGGELTYRLPAFRLAELNRISEVFNRLADELSKATTERTELARRLVDTQEQERRHIARELHDEIAQKLAALNALAASIRTSARRDAPAIVDQEARQMQAMASALMKTLRQTLTYLRPQEIDDLGLIPSLRALIEQHNAAARGHTTYSIETAGKMEHIGAEASAHVYRIVQEALTNASKHADARTVKVQLNRLGDVEREGVSLSVVNDGAGHTHDDRPSRGTGSGLIGMRERVMALSGKFVAGPLPNGGFGLHVEFPTAQRGA